MSKFALEMTATQVLLVGSVSYITFGFYIANFALAIWSTRLTRDAGSSTIQKCILWIICVTAMLITLRQVTISLWLAAQICKIKPPTDYRFCDAVYNPKIFFLVPYFMNVYTPPLVAFLSDGILAWRVYVAWHQPTWLLYASAGALTIICVTGLSTPIWISTGQNTSVDMYPFEEAWAWMTFIANSALSLSVLIRINRVNDFQWQGRGVHHTLLRALVESAALSWIATLSCAVVWGYTRTSTNFQGFFPGSAAFIFTPLQRFETSIFYALPSVLGISQVLIITRVNLSKFEEASGVIQTATAPTPHWENTEADD